MKKLEDKFLHFYTPPYPSVSNTQNLIVVKKLYMCFLRKQVPSMWMKYEYHYQITEVIKFGLLYSKQGRFLPLILTFMWFLLPIFSVHM